eukprot:scaffold2388_cov57-Cyclotella_meneghiniana.AAC.2
MDKPLPFATQCNKQPRCQLSLGRLFLDDPLEKGELSAAVALPLPRQPIRTDSFGHTASSAH